MPLPYHPDYTPCHVGKAGDFAFLDAGSAAGLVPCKVLSVAPRTEGGQEVEIRLTATRRAWKRGEVLIEDAYRVVPRKAVYRRSYSYGIRTYTWNAS
jgi:hypothetical protein